MNESMRAKMEDSWKENCLTVAEITENNERTDYGTYCLGFQAAHDIMQSQIDELVEALEFVTMPITNNNPSVEGLLQTMDLDRHAANKALAKHRTEKD